MASEPLGDEYEPVSLRLSAGGISLTFFLTSLLAHYVPWPWGRFIWIPISMALSLAGLIAGLVGLKLAERKSTARIGVALNAVVLALFVLFVLVVNIVLRRF